MEIPKIDIELKVTGNDVTKIQVRTDVGTSRLTFTTNDSKNLIDQIKEIVRRNEKTTNNRCRKDGLGLGELDIKWRDI